MEEASQSVQKQNPIQAPEEPVKRNFNWIYIFIGVFTLLIISAVFYLGRLSSNQPQQISISPTPQISKPIDETANLKTYTNTAFNYSFQYSSKYKVFQYNTLADSKGGDREITVISITEAMKGGEYIPLLNLQIIPTTGDISSLIATGYGKDGFLQNIRSYLGKSVGTAFSPPIQEFSGNRAFTKMRDENINGIVFEVFVRDLKGTTVGGIEKNLVTTHKDFIYIIRTLNQDDKDFQQILSTFKFTDQNQVNNPTSISPNLKTFKSDTLGIEFTYLEKQGDEIITAKEIGNKVYVYVAKRQPTDGQSVEVFQKERTETLEQAIKRKFLTGYSEKDCFVSTNYPFASRNYPSNYQLAIISFPKSTDPNSGGFENASKCPIHYVTAGGVSYFLMDTNHPNKFYYFSIGQYGIMADDKRGWGDTIQILN